MPKKGDSVADQNQRYLDYIAGKGPRPSYEWVDALNVPAKPPTPEELHARHIDEHITETVGIVRRELGQWANSTTMKEQIQQKHEQAGRVLELAVGYGQDITRVPAFFLVAAYHKIQSEGSK